MTRTITTADLAPLVTRHGADFETSKWTVELGFPASEPVSIHSWQADLLAAIPSAHAPVVSDAAVDAAARAIHAEGWTCEAHEPMGLDACEQCATSTPRLARAALSDALPFLGAAPSATREDVEAAIFEADDECALEVHEVRSLASRLLARFTITPRADR